MRFDYKFSLNAVSIHESIDFFVFRIFLSLEVMPQTKFFLNAIVELFDSDGNLVGTAITDENGFYYFLDIAVGNYTVKVTYNFQTYIQVISVAKNELAQVDFTIG